MSGEQLMVLALLLAAFAAGWVARGTRYGQQVEPDGEADPVEEARRGLEQCVAAGIDAEALGRALDDLDRLDPELERQLGADHPAYRAFDRALNQGHFLHRAVRAGEGRPLPATLAAADDLAREVRAYRAASVERPGPPAA